MPRSRALNLVQMVDFTSSVRGHCSKTLEPKGLPQRALLFRRRRLVTVPADPAGSQAPSDWRTLCLELIRV